MTHTVAVWVGLGTGIIIGGAYLTASRFLALMSKPSQSQAAPPPRLCPLAKFILESKVEDWDGGPACIYFQPLTDANGEVMRHPMPLPGYMEHKTRPLKITSGKWFDGELYFRVYTDGPTVEFEPWEKDQIALALKEFRSRLKFLEQQQAREALAEALSHPHPTSTHPTTIERLPSS